MDIYEYDNSLRGPDLRIVGIDEAGRGPLAGPVVAAAVALPSGKRFKGLRDSKLVPEHERKSLFFELLQHALDIGIGIIDVDVIDRVNILRATRLAMESAVKNLSLKPDILLIDTLSVPSIDIKQVSIIKGELKSALIAGASIVAKFTRDSLMSYYHSIYPEYGFNRHKGYCTEEHIKMIQIHGPCPIHRKSFKKVLSLGLPF